MSNKSAPRFPANAVQYHNKMNHMLTREEVERQMHAEARLGIQNKNGNMPSSLSHVPSPLMHPPMLRPIGPPPVRIEFFYANPFF